MCQREKLTFILWIFSKIICFNVIQSDEKGILESVYDIIITFCIKLCDLYLSVRYILGIDQFSIESQFFLNLTCYAIRSLVKYSEKLNSRIRFSSSYIFAVSCRTYLLPPTTETN